MMENQCLQTPKICSFTTYLNSYEIGNYSGGL